MDRRLFALLPPLIFCEGPSRCAALTDFVVPLNMGNSHAYQLALPSSALRLNLEMVTLAGIRLSVCSKPQQIADLNTSHCRQALAARFVVPERRSAGRHLPADLRGHRQERAHRQGGRRTYDDYVILQ